jgi:fumarate reductase flavoprotein subunit
MQRTVIVVGAGGAGLAAALEASRAGASVTVLEAGEKAGGATARAGGVIYAADTAVQKAAGIEDSVAELINYYQTVSHHRLEPRMLRTSAEGTRGLIDWLGQLGITWDPSRLYVAGLEFRPRGHLPTGDRMGFGPAGGAMIIAALWTAVQAAGVPVRTGVRVASLETAADGAVTGVVTEDGERLAADSVVLATGGFGAGREMLAELWPEATEQGDWHWYLGPDTNVGDGIAMAREVGGVVVNPGAGTLLETPNFGRLNDAFTPPWLIYVNRDGQRFIDETDTYCVMGHVIGKQPDGRCWAVFDEASLVSMADDDHVDPYGLGIDLESNWAVPMLRRQIEAGKVRSGQSLAELAAGIGVSAEGLQATAEFYNADVAAGRDTVFEKKSEHLRPVATAPFYAVELRPAIIGMTFTGLRVDNHTRVLDRAGRPIGRLYAAGEVTGGLDQDVYAGGGTSIGNALVFGRIAGANAARGGAQA